jgi:hypothetical protein
MILKDGIKTHLAIVVEESELYKYVRDHWKHIPFTFDDLDFREFIRDKIATYVRWDYDDFVWCIAHYGAEYRENRNDEISFFYAETSKILKDAIDDDILPKAFLVKIEW